MVDTFAQTDIFDRNLELIGNTQHDTTLGCSIQLCDSQCVYFGCFGKLLGLFKGVLSGGCVQNQQNFVWRIGYNLLHHILDLAQFVHQSHFVVQTSGGVDQYYVSIVGYGRFQSVEHHRGGICAHLLPFWAWR